LPLMVQHRTPIVIAAHASLMMVKKGEVEIKIKPVVNYKQTTLVGVFCPFTQKFLGAGVDTSLHVAVPLRVGVALKHGQFAVTLKTPEDAESQKVKPVIELKVLPFTAKKTLPDSVILDKTDEVKTIHTHYEKKVKELQLGEKLGVDLKLRIESEHKFVDLANFFLELRQHQLLTLINLPLPFRTARAHSVSLIYNPMTSIAKEATFVFGLGYGRKTSANDKPMMIYPTYQKDPEIEKQCKYNDAQNEKQQECLRKMFCSKEKETCHTELKKQNKPAGEVTKYCTWKHAQCNQRHFIRQNTRHVLSKLGAGTALTLNAIALVQGDNLNVLRKVETHFTLGHKPGHHKAGEKSAIKLMAGLVTAPDAKPFDFDIDAAINVVRPINKWDKEAILLQDPKADVTVDAQFGWRGEEKKAVIANVKALQSVDQKTFAKESDAAKKCEADNAKGRKLTKYCKQARARASSLDVVEAEINLPVVFSRHPLVKTLVEVVKVLYFPYLTILPAQQPAQQMKGFDKLVVRAKINQLGKRMSLNIFTPEQHIEAKHIRLGNKLHDLLPFNTKENMLINVVQKLTAHGAPSVCAVEGGKVRTFDKVEYDYTLNDCEHVIFKDCSPANTVEVTVKKNTNIHLVKLFLDNNKYELELMRSARAARTVIAVVRVNGEKKQFVELAENFFVDENTYITSYEDGVFAIVSKLYGLSIFADIDRVEVRTFQHRWRNQACGLCGDLNDEKTADLKSAGNCIMSDPKLAAFSYMVADNKCQGMPDKYKTMYQTEAAKCIKKKLVPTKVTEIFKQKQFPTMRHIVDVKTHKVCISKTRVNVCKPLTIPKEIIGKKVAFFCLPRDAKGETLRRVAERGGRIENAKMFPNKYIKEVAQPIKC